MTRCGDEELGRLLHDYELCLLADEQRSRFELHLYDCAHCSAEVRSLARISRALMEDADAVRALRRLGEADAEPQTRVSGSPWFHRFRYLAAAVLVVALAGPLYRMLRDADAPVPIQKLQLLPTRSGGDPVIQLAGGGEVELSFYMAESFQGTVRLVIAGASGDTLVDSRDFDLFNPQGLGRITLPVGTFSEGHYLLYLSPEPGSGTPPRTYTFRAK